MSNFDFLAAINGEPIYCKLDYKLITPYYSITEKQFLWGGANWDIQGNGINSIALQLYGNLTTDPPKKKMKKTVTIYKSKTREAYEIWPSVLSKHEDYFKYWYKCGETEIEVAE